MKQVDRFLQDIKPAPVYQPADDLWVVTSFFNSQNYSTKYINYTLFINSLEKSGINYLVIECAFNDQPFTLPNSPHILKVRSKSILWQKERLLNIAISSLPPSCTKVAWLDCDVFFENELWAVETSKILDSYTVVQPFDFVIRLPKGVSCYEGKGDRWESFASVYQKNPNQLPISDFTLHGHTGFAWAIRRSIVSKHDLYDTCISGSADHLMAHAFIGDFYSGCINQLLGQNDFTVKHFHEWAQAVYSDVSGKIGYVPGTLLHLWHGDMINRQYLKRSQELAQFKFNPYEDILINSEKCWEWSYKDVSKIGLHEWAIDFYDSRREDG
jgi:hypothetical protein